MIDWINPTEDMWQCREAGHRDRDNEVENLESEVSFLEEKHNELKQALSFAACCIKSGESWTETCEEIIGKLLKEK